MSPGCKRITELFKLQDFGARVIDTDEAVALVSVRRLNTALTELEYGEILAVFVPSAKILQ